MAGKTEGRYEDAHGGRNAGHISPKSLPAFNVANVGEENKWVTLYACMARE